MCCHAQLPFSGRREAPSSGSEMLCYRRGLACSLVMLTESTAQTEETQHGAWPKV